MHGHGANLDREKTLAMREKIKQLSLEATAAARKRNEMLVREKRNAQVENLQVYYTST